MTASQREELDAFYAAHREVLDAAEVAYRLRDIYAAIEVVQAAGLTLEQTHYWFRMEFCPCSSCRDVVTGIWERGARVL